MQIWKTKTKKQTFYSITPNLIHGALSPPSSDADVTATTVVSSHTAIEFQSPFTSPKGLERDEKFLAAESPRATSITAVPRLPSVAN